MGCGDRQCSVHDRDIIEDVVSLENPYSGYIINGTNIRDVEGSNYLDASNGRGHCGHKR